MWQRFTERARKVIFYSQEEAQRFGEGYVSTEHILLGLTRESDTVSARVLERLGCSLNRIRAEVEKQLPRGDARPSRDMTLTPRAKRVIDLAYDEARNLNNDYIGTEHLLLGLIRESDGLAGRVLAKLGVELEKARREVMRLQDQDSASRGEDPVHRSEPVPRETPPSKRPALSFEPYGFLLGQCMVEHLFLAATSSDDTVIGKAIRALVPDMAILQAQVWELIRKRVGRALRPGDPSELETVLATAHEEAQVMEDEGVKTHHLVLAICRVQDSELAQVLTGASLTYEALHAEVEKQLAEG